MFKAPLLSEGETDGADSIIAVTVMKVSLVTAELSSPDDGDSALPSMF